MTHPNPDQDAQLPLMNPKIGTQSKRIDVGSENEGLKILHYIYTEGDDLPLLKSVDNVPNELDASN